MTLIITLTYLISAGIMFWHSAESDERRPLHRAMLYAFVEGLCGVEDLGHSYQRVRCSPRWIATGEPEAAVHVGYAASGARFGYTYAHDADARTIRLRFDADAEVELHLLLPPGTRPVAATWEGDEVAFDPVTVEQSVYADAAGPVRAGSEVEVRYVDA